ncbi:ribbon-helix-helix protein, CopG family [Ancylothrix sp. C2]|uniref:ribbon-helix-helix protein, CopG family n=1 Tax=Ancylothrix sp. D3o TaxID=2953691 RepID=UPI0021BBA0AE|nr:ribbon-helix-helix protein, CopG family [Ancylothrix sp. D3o]MCT7952750.1 ribbon-helix-helix protein, CopG family [Ancylothrix sp. D3o]
MKTDCIDDFLYNFSRHQREDASLFDEVEDLVADLYQVCTDTNRDYWQSFAGSMLDCMEDESPHLETFEYYDSEIKDGLMAHVKVGVLLSRVARKCLYKLAGIKSFKEYCTKHLNKTSTYCVRLIKAAKTTLELIIAGFDRLPTNEAQCRPLTNLTGDELTTKWQEVLDRADKSNNRNSKGVITATMINEVVNGEPEPVDKKSVKISARSVERLEQLAKKLGKPVSELIEEAIRNLEFHYESEDNPDEEMVDCPQCGGTGEGEDDDCKLCEGEGLVSKKDANWYADFVNLQNEQPHTVTEQFNKTTGPIIPAT